jgi:hypothetical protein
MKNLWLIAGGVAVAGTAAYLISRNLNLSKEESIPLAKGKRRHVSGTDAFKKSNEFNTSE